MSNNGRGRSYSAEDHDAALLALAVNAGNIRRTARELGMPAPTLRQWRDVAQGYERGMADAQAAPDRARAITQGYADVQLLAQSRMREMIPASTRLHDVAYASSISADKHLDYRDGRKGMEVNVNQQTLAVLDLPADQLAAMLKAIRADPALEGAVSEHGDAQPRAPDGPAGGGGE